MKKVSAVRKVRTEEKFHAFEPGEQEGRSLQDVVEDTLRGPVTNAVVTLAPSAGEELARRGTRDGDTVTLTGVERDWVVRTIASLAGSVVSVEPADVRADVVELLREVEQ